MLCLTLLFRQANQDLSSSVVWLFGPKNNLFSPTVYRNERLDNWFQHWDLLRNSQDSWNGYTLCAAPQVDLAPSSIHHTGCSFHCGRNHGQVHSRDARRRTPGNVAAVERNLRAEEKPRAAEYRFLNE